MVCAGAPSRQVAAHIISKQQREVSVVVGETLTMECVASGWPVPEVTWSRYGGQLPRQRHHQLNGWFVYLSNARCLVSHDHILQSSLGSTP